MKQEIKHKENFIVKHRKTIIDYVVLIIGCIACCFTRFTFNMWFCAFIFPACFLFFERRQKAYIGLPLIFVASVIGCGISAWKVVIAAGTGTEVALSFLLGTVVIVPYILDKLIYVRFFSKHPLVLSFLFPLTWVILDIIIGLTPVGNIPSLAYALCQIIQVASIMSVLGINFLTFTIVYFCSAITQFAIDFKKNFKSLIIAGSIIGVSLVYSGIYNAASSQSQPSLNVMTGYSTNDGGSYERSKLDVDESINWLNEDAKQIDSLKSTNPIDMLVYPEETFFLYEEDVDKFKTALHTVADTNNVYIITGIEIRKDASAKDGFKNLGWIVQPNNPDIIEYQKTHLVPIDEEGYVSGTGDIKYIDIPNKGRVGLVICMDLEFPTYITKVGRLGCDTLIAPSWDWPTMHSIHSQSVCYRAIENGVNFLRCTEAGTSIACDYKGNIITQYYTAYDASEKQTHANHVFRLPMKGRKTLYSYLGLVTNYLYPIALASLIIPFAIIDHKKKPKTTKKAK